MGNYFSQASMVGIVGIVLLLSAQKDPAQRPAETAAQVPVGAIIMWWGRAVDIPEGFEVCDGTNISTRDAILRGRKPDLRNKFARGALDYRGFVPQAFAGGGEDVHASQTVPVSIADHTDRLTKEQIPDHVHEIGRMAHVIVDQNGAPLTNDPTNQSSLDHTHATFFNSNVGDAPAGGGSYTYLTSTSQSVPTTAPVWTRNTAAIGAKIAEHATSYTVKTNPPGHNPAPPLNLPAPLNLHHSGTVTVNLDTIRNVPAYLDVVFLVRVK